MKIGIIGFGHLAKSFAKGLLKTGTSEEDIFITDVKKENKQKALLDLGIVSFPTNRELVDQIDLVVLATRPSDAGPVLEEIKNKMKNKVLVSFLAGTKLEKLESFLGPGQKIIRVMPSIAMEEAQSLTAICPNENVEDEEKKNVLSIFSSLGTASITSEDDLERMTVISGSGIAVIADFIRSYSQAARSIGYKKDKPEEVEKEAIQVIKGTLALLEGSSMDAEAMVGAVATEGGTTIEAIKVMEDAGFEDILKSALGAAHQRALDLN